MNESIYKYCKPGTVFFKSFPRCHTGADFDEILKRAEQIACDTFFKTIEVGKIGDMLIRSRVSRMFEYARMNVVYATQPILFWIGGKTYDSRPGLCALEKKNRDQAIAWFDVCLEEAANFKATAIRIPSGDTPVPYNEQTKEDSKKYLIDSLCTILENSKQWGSPLITLKIFDYDVHCKQLIGPCQDALDVAKAVCPHYDNFGLLCDMSHFPLLREDMATTIHALKPYLKAFQLGNCVPGGNNLENPIHGDWQPRFGCVGGVNDEDTATEYISILLREGLLNPVDRPCLTAEVRPLLGDESEELILANTKRVFQEAWARAEA